MKQKVIIAVVVALVLIATIFLYSQSRKTTDSNSINTNQNSNTPQEGDFVGDATDQLAEDPQTPTTDTIAVSTQIAGDSVTIDNAFLSKAGFISIHEVNSKGMAGTIIGTSGYLGVGAKQDLEINATLKPGAKYIAMIREDNGDKKFTDQQDAAVMNNNAPVMVMFSVSQ